MVFQQRFHRGDVTGAQLPVPSQQLHLGHLARGDIDQRLCDFLFVLEAFNAVGLTGGVKALMDVIGDVQRLAASGCLTDDQQAVRANGSVIQICLDLLCQQRVFHQAVHRIAELAGLGRHPVQQSQQRLILTPWGKKGIGMDRMGER